MEFPGAYVVARMTQAAQSIRVSQLITFPTRSLCQRVVNFGVGLIMLLFGMVFLLVSMMAAVGVLGSSDNASINNGVVGFSLLMGLFFFGLTWMLRLYVLPFRFVADAVRRECAYRWGNWTTARVHIPETSTFLGQLIRYQDKLHYSRAEGRWKWSVIVVDVGTGRRRKVFTSPENFFIEEKAMLDCQEYLQGLGECFSLPYELAPEAISVSLT